MKAQVFIWRQKENKKKISIFFLSIPSKDAAAD
jgi:hypothetical protein